MTKPQPKVEVAISSIIKSSRILTFYATPDAAEEFSSFGSIIKNQSDNFYVLTVDTRYDFDEVVAYIEAYNKD